METVTSVHTDEPDISRFMDLIEMPHAFSWAVPVMFEPEDISTVLDRGHGPYMARDMDGAWLAHAYRCGILDLVESGRRPQDIERTYALGTFYSMLDIFVIDRYGEYRALDAGLRDALDGWYFDTYCARTFAGGERVPTDDRVVPLQEAIALVERDERPIYLNACDCRSLRGDCELPRMTCLTYLNGPNSVTDRLGLAPISKSRACDVLRDADAAGLMHTANAHGLCNCCTDCCYLFRAQRRQNTVRTWPASDLVARVDRSACRGCGLCARRCRMGAITFKDGTVDIDASRCVGCGLCVSRCPAHAIDLDGTDGE